MSKELLPIGSLIELSDGIRFVILGYEENSEHHLCYLCGVYPCYNIMDLIPIHNVNEFKKKYVLIQNFKYYYACAYLDINSEYNIIHVGYKNNSFYELQNKYRYLDL